MLNDPIRPPVCRISQDSQPLPRPLAGLPEGLARDGRGRMRSLYGGKVANQLVALDIANITGNGIADQVRQNLSLLIRAIDVPVLTSFAAVFRRSAGLRRDDHLVLLRQQGSKNGRGAIDHLLCGITAERGQTSGFRMARVVQGGIAAESEDDNSHNDKDGFTA